MENEKITKKRNAFTMVETMMTLMIIAVIATVTTLVLRDNVSPIETRAKLNAAQSIITQAILQYQAEHFCGGNLAICDDFTVENPDIEQIYSNIFMDKLKLQQNCGILIGQGCFSSQNYIYQNRSLYERIDANEDAYKVRLLNGMSIAFSVPNAKCADGVCMHLIVDINGPAGPNTINKDTFEGVITTNMVKFITEN